MTASRTKLLGLAGAMGIVPVAPTQSAIIQVQEVLAMLEQTQATAEYATILAAREAGKLARDEFHQAVRDLMNKFETEERFN